MCQSDSASRENDHCNHTLFVIGNPMRLQFQSRRGEWRAGKIVWRACELNVFMFFSPPPFASLRFNGGPDTKWCVYSKNAAELCGALWNGLELDRPAGVCGVFVRGPKLPPAFFFDRAPSSEIKSTFIWYTYPRGAFLFGKESICSQKKPRCLENGLAVCCTVHKTRSLLAAARHSAEQWRHWSHESVTEIVKTSWVNLIPLLFTFVNFKWWRSL